MAKAAPHTTPLDFTISIVSSVSDQIAVADLRYDEWCNDGAATSPSRHAFRQATREIIAERKDHSTIFLAHQEGVAVGAGECSTLELQGALSDPKDDAFVYVTDVVTAKVFRRRGVARALLCAMESTLSQQHTNSDHQQRQSRTIFLLHVSSDNKAALGFYRTLGYRRESTDDELRSLDAEQLATNAATHGQILLWKQVGG